MRWLSLSFLLVGCSVTPAPAPATAPTPAPTPVSTPECEAMLACDAALAAEISGYTAVFEGADDPVYGPDGSCYDDFGTAECSEECLDGYVALIDAVATFIVLGELSDVPQGCISDVELPEDTGTPPTPTPPPPTPEPFEWNVVLTDGDGQSDDANFQDADTITVETRQSVANYPDVVEWEFGAAQTEIGFQSGWYGEDCDGAFEAGMDVCHPMAADTTMVLQRVFNPSDIVGGSTTLLSVDYPESATPGMTYVLYGYDSSDAEQVCFRMGHQPSYYNGFGCEDYTP